MRNFAWVLLAVLGLRCLVAFAQEPFKVVEGPDWVAFDYRRDIEPGSALDFSSVAPTDAPAGKYGRLRVVGERFEFEGLPGVAQRFYGVNLCMSANYPTHEEAEMIVTRFRRMGYNAIRLHHHDKGWQREADRERLDYLVATAIRAGFYLTTDLYVSRTVRWRDLGIDLDGTVPPNAYKALVNLHEPAFADWCRHAEEFLRHVNPLTHRAYIDEPALVTLVTLNENWMANCRRFLKNVPPWKGRKMTRDEMYAADAAGFERQRDFLRSLGVRNPLSAGNHSPQTEQAQRVRARLFDYVDEHCYESHPKYLNKENKFGLPRLYPERDYFDPAYFDTLAMNRKSRSRVAGKPFTVSEWNCCAPSGYRQAGGLYGGALFAAQNWSGVWRFAYAHHVRNLHDIPREPAAFDVSADPIMAAQERQVVPLFRRGDLTDAAQMRVDFTNRVFTVVTPRTCGGAGPAGAAFSAGALSARIAGTRAAVSAVSLDGAALADARRILVAHLTDAKGRGATFERTAEGLKQIGPGDGTILLRDGAADITLRLSASESWKAYALASTGARRFEVPVEFENGLLHFTARVRGTDGRAVMEYEIVRD